MSYEDDHKDHDGCEHGVFDIREHSLAGRIAIPQGIPPEVVQIGIRIAIALERAMPDEWRAFGDGLLSEHFEKPDAMSRDELYEQARKNYWQAMAAADFVLERSGTEMDERAERLRADAESNPDAPRHIKIARPSNEPPTLFDSIAADAWQATEPTSDDVDSKEQSES